MHFTKPYYFALSLLLALSACASPSGIQPRGFPVEDLPLELERFAGEWHVIAHIPLSVEEEAFAATEEYSVRENGEIDVLFRFCDGSAEGPFEEMTMRAWVFDSTTNAEWRVRPVWPLRLSYQILELDPEYDFTVVGHPSKDYAWVMSRSPQPSEARVVGAIERLEARGYDMAKLRRVPQPEKSCRTRENR